MGVETICLGSMCILIVYRRLSVNGWWVELICWPCGLFTCPRSLLHCHILVRPVASKVCFFDSHLPFGCSAIWCFARRSISLHLVSPFVKWTIMVCKLNMITYPWKRFRPVSVTSYSLITIWFCCYCGCYYHHRRCDKKKSLFIFEERKKRYLWTPLLVGLCMFGAENPSAF